jgi:hypothetical protein
MPEEEEPDSGESERSCGLGAQRCCARTSELSGFSTAKSIDGGGAMEWRLIDVAWRRASEMSSMTTVRPARRASAAINSEVGVAPMSAIVGRDSRTEDSIRGESFCWDSDGTCEFTK